MHLPDGLDQFLPEHVLDQVSGSASFKGPDCLYIAAVGGQDNDTGVRKVLANGQNCVGTVHNRHLQIHESYVRTMMTELLDRFWSVTGFRYESYVRFTRKDCGDPFAQYRMVVDRKNSNGGADAHRC
jgi:hypothetical protein